MPVESFNGSCGNEGEAATEGDLGIEVVVWLFTISGLMLLRRLLSSSLQMAVLAVLVREGFRASGGCSTGLL